MEAMASMKDKAFELAIVDPPYGIGAGKGTEIYLSNNGKQDWKGKNKNDFTIYGDWDDSIPDEKYFTELFRVSINQIIWGGNYFLDYLGRTNGFAVWDKMNGTNPMADAELAWTSFNKSTKMFRMHHFSAGYDAKIHPTQKPIALYGWILRNYAKPGQRILDTHLGSGSSAIAAHYFGCDFVGCEIDVDYFNAAKERFDRETRQVAMF